MSLFPHVVRVPKSDDETNIKLHALRRHLIDSQNVTSLTHKRCMDISSHPTHFRRILNMFVLVHLRWTVDIKRDETLASSLRVVIVILGEIHDLR
jgi:hypothetical protein